MTGKISVIINTYNEEKTIERAIKSVLWADEILVCDMNSQDNSALIAKKLGAKVIFHKHVDFVEPARNFAISKAENEWILVLDPDEEIPESLGSKLKEIAKDPGVTTFVEIPRKNMIFGKWIKSSMWWPDYLLRFFKQGFVLWGDQIHRPPETQGQGIKLPLDERWAITHYHYDSISQYLGRMDRYTNVQARELKRKGNEFIWTDLLTKPLNEFLSRYFANRGFEDGLHGLALSLLQAFSFLVVYLKLWELKEFKQVDIKFSEVHDVAKKGGEELNYWFKYGDISKNKIKAFLQKAKNKIT